MRDKYLLGSNHHIASTCPSTAFPFICNHRALDPGSQKLMPLDLQWGEASAWKGIFQISINTANVTSTKKRATAEVESVVQLTGISTLNHHFVTINTVSFVKIHRESVIFVVCISASAYHSVCVHTPWCHHKHGIEGQFNCEYTWKMTNYYALLVHWIFLMLSTLNQ